MIEAARSPLPATRGRRRVPSGARGLVRLVRAALRPGRLAYALPGLAAVGAVQTWFRPGQVLASGDLVPPIVRNPGFLSHWNHLTMGEGSAGYDISSVQYLGLPFLANAAGIPAEVFQRTWLSLLYAGSAAAVVFLARQIGLAPLAAAAAGLIATFSAYHVVTGFDSIPLVTTIVGCVLGGLVVRAGLHGVTARRVCGFALASVGSALVFVNPPHLALLVLWVAVATVLAGALGGLRALARAWRLVLTSMPLAVALNLWWLVPAALTLTSADFAGRFAASGVDDWTWTHARASVPNALALNTTWAWSFPEYFPFAGALDASLVGPLRFAPAALALLGVVLAGRAHRRLALVLAGVALAAVFVAKGVHAPLGGLNELAYGHVPGFWLFRDPAKVLLLPALAFALLGGLAVGRLASLRRVRHLGVVLAAGAVGAAIAYAHPLYTGTAIPQERALLPPARVAVPQAWLDAAEYVDARPEPGKVLVLPGTGYYQVPTTWGYHGASFVKQLIRRPVIEPTTGGYFRSAPSVTALVASLSRDLAAGEPSGIAPRLRALGVGWVLLRRDLDRRLPKRRFEDPAKVAAGLADVPELTHARSFGLVDLYAVGGEPAEVTVAEPVAYEGSARAVPQAIVLARRGALVSAADAARARAAKPGAFRVEATEVLRVERERVWTLEARRSGDRVRLRLSDPLQVSAQGSVLSPAPPVEVSLPATGRAAAFSIAGRHVFVEQEVGNWEAFGKVRLGRRADVALALESAKADLLAGPPPALGDCNRSDDRSAAEVGLALALHGRADERTLRLSAREHAACVALGPISASGRGILRLALEYRHVSGRPPRVCLFDEGAERCASQPPLVTSPGWHSLNEAVRLERVRGPLRLYLYADGAGEPATVVEYRHVRIGRFEQVDARTLELAGPIASASVPPSLGVASARASSAFGAARLVPVTRPGSVGDCNRFDDRTQAEVGLSRAMFREGDRTIDRLAARDHTACVELAVEPFDPAALYRVRLDARHVAGRPPRACVVFEGTPGCRQLPALRRVRGWQRLDATVSPPNTARGLRLFLYADGTGDGLTMADYSGVQIRPEAPLDVIGLTRLQPASGLAQIAYRKLGPTRFQVDVTNASGPFLLVLAESFSRGWRVKRPEVASNGVAHLRVNGYANGWLVPWHGSYRLTLEYAPARTAELAQAASLATGGGLLLSALALGLIRRVRTRHR